MESEPFATLAASSARQPAPAGRPHLWAFIILVLLLMVAAVGILGTPSVDTTTPTPTPTTTDAQRESRVYTVSYRFGVFSPTNLRIHAGDTVRFRNDSTNQVRIVADAVSGRQPAFDSIGMVQPNGYFSYTFATVGTFTYHIQDAPNEAGGIIVR